MIRPESLPRFKTTNGFRDDGAELVNLVTQHQEHTA